METLNTLDNPLTINVPIHSESDLVQGLEQVIVETKNKVGYDIATGICLKCGTKDSFDTREGFKCPACRNTKFKIVDFMDREKTAKVLNTKSMWKCPECGKMYDRPTPCCKENFRLIAEKYGSEGYYCMGCHRIYDRSVRCCTGFRMIKGKYYPAEYKDYLKIPKVILPV